MANNEPDSVKSPSVTGFPADKDPFRLTWIDLDEESKSANNKYNYNLQLDTLAQTNKVLADLDPETMDKFILLFRQAYHDGLLPLYYSGYRSFDKQQELYDNYKRGGIIAAPPGKSYHNYGRAVDLLVHDLGGAGGQLPGGLSKINRIQKRLGLNLRWGASFDDPNHFADTSESIQELQENSPAYKAWIQGNPWTEAETKAVEEFQEEERLDLTWIQRNVTWFLPTLLFAVSLILVWVATRLRR